MVHFAVKCIKDTGSLRVKGGHTYLIGSDGGDGSDGGVLEVCGGVRCVVKRRVMLKFDTNESESHR